MSRWMSGRKNKELASWFYHLVCSELDLALYTRILGWQPERLHELLAGVRQRDQGPQISNVLGYVSIFRL